MTRKLKCYYDNEPLTRKNPETPLWVEQNCPEDDQIGCAHADDHASIPGDGKIPTTAILARYPVSLWVLLGPTTPEVRLSLDQNTFDYLLRHLQSFVSSFAHSLETQFLHPRLYEAGFPRQIQDAYALCQASMTVSPNKKGSWIFQRSLTARICGILQRSKLAASPSELLASAQALILTLIMLLTYGETWRCLTDALSTQLRRCTRRLWEAAPTHLPSCLSQWQAWVFAESVRRTILFAHMVLGHYAQSKQGYYVHTLFVEALPFDMRSRLWSAPEADAWRSSAGDNPTAVLTGYREFTNMWERGERNEFGLFEIMLLVACKGKDFVECSEMSRPVGGSSDIWLYL